MILYIISRASIKLTYRKFDHESVNNATKNSYEVKSVPGIFEVAL